MNPGPEEILALAFVIVVAAGLVGFGWRLGQAVADWLDL